MARDSGVSIPWPPGTPWLIVVLASAFFITRGPATTSPASLEQPPAVADPPPVSAPASGPSASPDAWMEDVWGTAELFRRFLGEVPTRERSANPVVPEALELHSTDELASLERYRQEQSNAQRRKAKDDLLALKTKLTTKRVDLSIVIATISDYYDSNGRWTADEILSTIQAAAGQASFALFDLYLPDWDTAPGGNRPRLRRDHEREPGALLFRKSDPKGGPSLLLVMLVPETPTAGVHGAVFRTALRFARWWAPGTIRVVGPSFSGSTLSMRLALEDLDRDTPEQIDVHIVSGMATSRLNAGVLQGPAQTDKRTLEVTYKTTVHHDEDLLRVLHQQLVRINPAWFEGRKVALLVDDTSWGAGVFARAALKEECEARKNPPAKVGSQLPCAILLSFPLHISRLVGSSAGDARTASTPSLPPWVSQLLPRAPGLGDTVTPTDALPVFTPNTTSTIVGAMLHDTLETLANGEFGAVGIVATDKRDHLFLAREINKVAPNVLMFGTEPHVLMLHPDYQPYVRGTLMASSYPAHAHTQRLTGPAGQGGRQFASMSAEGMYNALLTVLSSEAKPLPLIDYAPPWVPQAPQTGSLPVPWVVIVGRDAFLPVVAGEIGDTTKGQLAVNLAPDGARQPTDYLLASSQSRLLWALPLFLLFGHLAVLLAARFTHVPGFGVFSPPAEPSGGHYREHTMLVLGCGLSLGLGLAWQLRLWEVLSLELPAGAWVSRGAQGAFLAVLLTTAAAAVLIAIVGAQRVRAEWQNHGVALPTLTSLVAIGVALAMTVAFSRYLMDGELWTGTAAVFHVERILGLAALTSPLPAITAVLGLGYGWAFWGLRSLHHHVVDARRAGPLFALFGGKDSLLSMELMLGARSTVHPSGWWTLLIIGLVGAGILIGVPRTHAVDGADLGWVIALGSVLGVAALSIELGQAAWLGSRLKDALEYLRGHDLEPTIAALGKEPVDWGMSLEPRHGSTKRLLAERLTGLQRQLRSFQDELKEAVAPVPVPVPDPERRQGVSASVKADPWERALARRLEIRSGDVHQMSGRLLDSLPLSNERPAGFSEPHALLRTPLWTKTLDVAAILVPPLENRFWRARRPIEANSQPGRFIHDAQLMVAWVTAVVLRTLVVRVVRGLSIAAVIGATLLVGHLFYTFPGRRFWLLLDFVALLFVAVVSVRQLLALERDHMLSRLWSSTPGQVGLSSGLLWRAMASATLPLLTLLAVMFPEVGGSFVTWLEPLRQFMPMR